MKNLTAAAGLGAALIAGSVAQIMDRNWTVCSSTPAPGTTFAATTTIDFGVVRDTEVCP